MASSYVGYQGYGDPARAQVDRKRQLAELLQQGATDTSPKSFWEGAAQLGKAFIARGANERADAAESAYATDKARRLAQYFNPNADEQGRNMAPDVNVSADVEPALPTTDAHIKALASTFAGSVAPQGGSAPLPAGGQMAPAPASTPTTNVKAIAAALTPVETGMPGPGQISMAEPVSMPMTAAQMPKAGPDEVALFQQAMRITGGDLMQARALVESRMAPVRDAEARAYRDKTDARRDFVDDRGYNAGREDAGRQADQWQQSFEQNGNQWNKTFGETTRHNRVAEGQAAEELKAKTAALGMPDVSDENGFTNQYLGQAKTFQGVRDAQSRIQAVGNAKNPAEQMSLIFGYMKMLDPGSTVREGEYATAQNTTGMPGWVTNAYNKAKDGVFLNDQQVKDFLAQSAKQYKVAEDNYVSTVLNPYRERAPRYHMDPSIIQDFRLPPQQPKPTMAQQGINALGDAVKGFGGMFMQPGQPQQGAQQPPMQRPMQPQAQPPAGVDPVEWQHMTPEEKALFQ